MHTLYAHSKAKRVILYCHLVARRTSLFKNVVKKKLPFETLTVKFVFCFFLPIYVHTEAAVAGWWTKCIDEEGAGHLLALLSDQPINHHSKAYLRCTQALCTKGPANIHVFTKKHLKTSTLFLRCGFIFVSFCSSPVRSSRVRQTCVAVCAMRSSSAVTIVPAPPRRRQLPCCIFSWEKTLSLPRASL